jgi:hypothetical protein
MEEGNGSGEPLLRVDRRYCCAILGVLLCLGIALRIAHWYPGYGSDDTIYMNTAAQMVRGEPLDHLLRHWNTRLAYLLFLAAGMSLGGTTTAVCQWLGMGVFVATALTIGALAARLGGGKQALLAVGLYVFLPLDMALSTCVLPDTLMTLAVLIACLLVVHATECESRGGQLAWSLATGFTLGVAVSVKEMACVAGIPIGVYLVCRLDVGRWVAALTAMTLGGAAALAAECVGFGIWTGDPLFRFHFTSTVFATAGNWANPSTSFSEAAFYFTLLANSTGEYGIHGYVVLLAFLLALNDGRLRTMFPLMFCTLVGIYLSVGTAHLTSYVLVPHQARYFHVVMAMGCVLAGLVLPAASRTLRLRAGVAGALCFSIAGLSLWAAKDIDWRGTVSVAKWVGNLERDQADDLVLLDRIVNRQALELRQMVSGMAQVSEEIESPLDLAATLGGRGLVVDRWDLVLPSFGEERLEELERKLLNDRRIVCRREEILGDPWPPYKKWIGIGAQQQPIGSILWVSPAAGQTRTPDIP